MSVVYKYPIRIVAHQTIKVPEGARILTVQMQGDEACIWAKVDPDQREMELNIYVHGTGHTLHENALMYIGTIQQCDGNLIWHVFGSQV